MRRLRTDVWPTQRPLMGVFVLHNLEEVLLRTTRDRDLLAGRQVVAATFVGNAVAVPLIALALTVARRILR